MSVVSALLARFGYVRLRDYGMAIGPGGRILSLQMESTSDFSPPLPPAMPFASAAFRAPGAAPPRLLPPKIPEPAAQASAPPGVEAPRPAPFSSPAAPAAAAMTEAASTDAEDEWEWTMALARARAAAAPASQSQTQPRAAATPAVRPRPRPAATPAVRPRPQPRAAATPVPEPPPFARADTTVDAAPFAVPPAAAPDSIRRRKHLAEGSVPPPLTHRRATALPRPSQPSVHSTRALAASRAAASRASAPAALPRLSTRTTGQRR